MSPQPRYAVIGNPVEHSLSPQLFTWLFSELGIRADYSRQLVLPEDLPNIIARLNRGDWQGISVTFGSRQGARFSDRQGKANAECLDVTRVGHDSEFFRDCFPLPW